MGFVISYFSCKVSFFLVLAVPSYLTASHFVNRNSRAVQRNQVIAALFYNISACVIVLVIIYHLLHESCTVMFVDVQARKICFLLYLFTNNGSWLISMLLSTIQSIASGIVIRILVYKSLNTFRLNKRCLVTKLLERNIPLCLACVCCTIY